MDEAFATAFVNHVSNHFEMTPRGGLGRWLPLLPSCRPSHITESEVRRLATVDLRAPARLSRHAKA